MPRQTSRKLFLLRLAFIGGSVVLMAQNAAAQRSTPPMACPNFQTAPAAVVLACLAAARKQQFQNSTNTSNGLLDQQAAKDQQTQNQKYQQPEMLRKSNLYGSDEPTRLSAGGNAWEVPVPWPNGKAPDCDGALMSRPLEQRQKCTLETRIGPYKPGSMGGACASDRRSGGCFETETAFEKEQAERKVQYENFYSLMQRNVPNLPAFCTIGPNPEKNHGHELGPKVELTTEQVAICINAAEPVIAKQNELAGLNERQQHTKSVEAMMTQISKLPGASTFTTLSTCPKTADCLDDPFQKVWTPWIMADNGEGTKVD